LFLVLGTAARWLQACWRVALPCALLAWAAVAQAAAPGTGFVDKLEVRPEQRQLVVTGWAAPANPGVFTTNAIVRVGGEEIYRGRMQRMDRPDVVSATGHPEWLGSGFQVTAQLPRGLHGEALPVEVAIRLGSGEEFTLEALPEARQVAVPAVPRIGTAVGLALVLALVLPLGVLLAPRWRGAGEGGGTRWGGPMGAFALALGASFVLLVGAGVTGSSVALLLGQPSVTVSDEAVLLGEPRAIRSDEWQVFTPLALAQRAHQPAFPVHNTLLGADGQNMLVAGMTGLPVAHVSALARPATWGFFFLDLRRALAWAWWLPILGALAAWTWLLQRLLRLPVPLAAALGASGALAAYSTGFSGWPAYAALGPALALCLADVALRAQGLLRALLSGAGAGLAAAGFALLLYPAWQVPLATLFVPLALAWWWRDAAQWRWRGPQWLALLAAVLVGSGVLLAWWLDARDAVALMRQTVYPGQRVHELGGDIDRWFLLKGWLAPVSMYQGLPHLVASDAASYLFLPLATLAGFALTGLRQRRIDPPALVALGFAAFALAFMFAGFPAWLADATLWGSVTAYRLDLPLGMAQILLVGWLLGQAGESGEAGGAQRVLALLVAVASGAFVGWQWGRMPADLAAALPAGFVVLVMLLVAWLAAQLLLGHRRRFAAAWLGWTLAATLPFHPLGLGPSTLQLQPDMARLPLAEPGAGGARGVAVIGERNWAMTLPAAGVPVANGLFYTPEPGLWRSLDPEGRLRQLTNRYQRLLFELVPIYGEDTFRIVSPRLDEVRVSFDPGRFDFRRLGARYLLVPTAQAAGLEANASVRRVPAVDGEGGYLLFELTGRPA